MNVAECGDLVVVFVTASSREEGEKIARVLLEKKLVACVNIVENVTSLFWWRGAIDSSREVLLVMKTRAEVFDKLVEEIKKVHSYEVPEIISFKLWRCYEPYAAWVRETIEAR